MAACLFGLLPSGYADTLEWTAPVPGDFDNATKWTVTSGAGSPPPAAGDSIFLNEAGAYTIALTQDEAADFLRATSGTVSLLSDSSTARTLDLTTGAGDLSVRGGARLDFAAGSTLAVGRSGSSTSDGRIAITGGGDLVMSNIDVATLNSAAFGSLSVSGSGSTRGVRSRSTRPRSTQWRQATSRPFLNGLLVAENASNVVSDALLHGRSERHRHDGDPQRQHGHDRFRLHRIDKQLHRGRWDRADRRTGVELARHRRVRWQLHDRRLHSEFVDRAERSTSAPAVCRLGACKIEQAKALRLYEHRSWLPKYRRGSGQRRPIQDGRRQCS